MLMVALGLLLLSEIGLGGGLGGLLPSLAIVGVGVGLVTTPVAASALGGAGDDEFGVAAAALNTSRMVGLTLGIAFMGAIVAARWPAGFAAGPVSPGGLAEGLALAYKINAGIALVTAGVAAATLPGAKRSRVMRRGRHGRPSVA